VVTKSFSIKFEEEEFQEYKIYADDLGLPLGTFIKMVLKFYAEQLFIRIKNNNSLHSS
jgi:hypothetical protein